MQYIIVYTLGAQTFATNLKNAKFLTSVSFRRRVNKTNLA